MVCPENQQRTKPEGRNKGNDSNHDEGHKPVKRSTELIQQKLKSRITNFRNNRKKLQSKNLTVIKLPRNIVQALNLPKVMNLNLRSAMNKTEEITTFIIEEEIDLAIISESHDRENKRLEDHIHISTHTVISNHYQRPTKEKGGQPALIVDKDKYHVDNLTNTCISIPWGVEATWALLTPKNVTKDSIVKKIAVCALYVKPGSKKKTALADHIAEVYNMLKAKHGRGLYWVLAGDTNDLKLGPILRLNKNLKSVVKKPIRLNPENPSKSSVLDNIITDLNNWYQEPKCLAPIAIINQADKKEQSYQGQSQSLV